MIDIRRLDYLPINQLSGGFKRNFIGWFSIKCFNSSLDDWLLVSSCLIGWYTNILLKLQVKLVVYSQSLRSAIRHWEGTLCPLIKIFYKKYAPGTIFIWVLYYHFPVWSKGCESWSYGFESVPVTTNFKLSNLVQD